ncbi:MAG: MBL fold metallo-hydrolase [Gammaproteobacteria bacterium]|nr:MBL fold metallo-hydrolase [Gammaproteobacteria bacterium]MYJ75528.1 MBL fold metallo-hydrolase [Gammaproteobacteria bacterium]
MVSIPFRRALEFEYGEVAEVAPGIRRIIARNPSPFTLYGTGTYILGRGRVAVIDPGPADDAHIQAILRVTAGEIITHMLVTHTHMDHSPGCRLLAAHTDAKTYAFGSHGAGKIAAGVVVEEGGDMDFEPDIAVRDGDVVQGDGWSVTCVHTPGHTSNHICYASGEALFSGDHVMGWSTSVISPPDGDMSNYMASLELLLRRDDAVYWPTHGPPITDPKPHVRAFIEHRREREREIVRCLADGPKRIPEMVPTMYADVPKYLHGAAARSVFATMALLMDRGDVVCDGELDVGGSYRLAPQGRP